LLTVNGLVAADYILIPVQAEYYALEGLGQLINTINLVQEHLKPELSILGAVITMFDKRTRLSDQVMQELYKFFPDKIFRTVIPRNVRLSEAPSHGLPALIYDHRCAGSAAACQNSQAPAASTSTSHHGNSRSGAGCMVRRHWPIL